MGEHFKDAYLVEFTDLPDPHMEADLHRGLLRKLGWFITELGRDFCFVRLGAPDSSGSYR